MKRAVVSMAAACAVALSSLHLPTASAVIDSREVVRQAVTPDQNEHRSDFVNDERCDPVADARKHPYEQWITDEWDRYNGTTSFTNTSNRPIKFSLEVTEGVNESIEFSTTPNAWDVFFNPLKTNFGLVRVSEWAVGDKLGPVVVQPGETVRADYGVHMKSFIGRVRTCDQRTGLWRTEPYFGEYHGEGPQRASWCGITPPMRVITGLTCNT